MRSLVALPFSLLVLGCVPLAPRIYLPDLGNEQISGWKMCTPNYRIELFSKENVIASLSVMPRSDVFGEYLELQVPTGTSVKLKSNVVSISAHNDGPQEVIFEKRATEHDQPRQGVDTLRFLLIARTPNSPERITLQLPELEINGRNYLPLPVDFSLRRKPMLVGVCQ